MTGALSLGLVADLAVALLLIVTIGYCTVLNRRLKRLRADEGIFRTTIAELLAATDTAERSVLALKAAAGESDRTLGQRLKAADGCAADLAREIAAGERLYDRLAQITRAATPRPATASAPLPAPTAVAPAPAFAPQAAVTTAPPVVAAAPQHTAVPTDPRALQKAAADALERLRAARRAGGVAA